MLALTVASFTPTLVGGATAHAPVSVPRLAGHTRAQVFAQMRRAGLYFITVGPGSRSGHWVVATGQSPRAGTVVAWHSQITIHVTDVTPRGPRVVPDLVGRSRAQVFALMHHASLYFRTVGPSSWAVATSQSPRAGTVVAWHSEVTVHVRTATRAAVSTAARAPAPAPTFSAPAAVDERAAISAGHYRYGIATWYSYFPGRCATWFLPMGTVVTVRNLATGHTVSCVVTDHEAGGTDRIIDLSEAQFAQLAPLGQGVIKVRVVW